MSDETITFSLETDVNLKDILTSVYDSLVAKDYNAINQIAGYLLSGDPTYITTHNNARSIIQKVDRYELLKALIKSYLIN
mgnify:CR=1 FL=1